MLRHAIFDRCTTAPILDGLIGTRCYPSRLPDGVTLPALTYDQISDDDFDYRAHGEAAKRAVARITFNCWGSSADEAAEVADALIAAWTGYRSPPDIGWAQIALRQDSFEESLGRNRTIVDVQVEYARTGILPV